MTLSIIMLYHYAKCYYAMCHIFFIFMLNVTLLSFYTLNVTLLSFYMLNVVMLSVVKNIGFCLTPSKTKFFYPL